MTKMYFSHFWRLEVQDQGVVRSALFRGFPLYLMDGCLLVGCSDGLLSVLCISCITPCVQISSSCNCGVLSHGRVFETPWTVARQACLFMGFPRQEFWSGFPFPPPGDGLNPGVEPVSLVSPAAGRFFITATWEAIL